MRPSIARRTSNMPRRHWLRAASLVAPALVALGALAGVTAPEAVSLSEAREVRALEEARAAVHRIERDKSAQFRALDVEKRAQRVIAASRSRIPTGIDPIVAQGAVRVACERAGFELNTLTLGVDRDPGLPQTIDRIALRVVDLGGRARLGALPELFDELDALGMPACALEASVELPRDGGARAEVRLQLGLLHFAPALAPEFEPESDSACSAADLAGGQEDQP